jgi:hypothetical protein
LTLQFVVSVHNDDQKHDKEPRGVWGVFTDTSRYTEMLTGTYAGATAEATLAAGLGANVLIGGSNLGRAIAVICPGPGWA